MKMPHLQIRDSPTISFLKIISEEKLERGTDAREHVGMRTHTHTHTTPCVQGMLYPSRANTGTQAEVYIYSRWGTEDEGLRTPAHMDTAQREERKASDRTRTLLKPRDQERLGGRSAKGVAEGSTWLQKSSSGRLQG